jgi:hypothetical protein
MFSGRMGGGAVKRGRENPQKVLLATKTVVIGVRFLFIVTVCDIS